ncbi:Creatininase [Methylocella silvestris BL2]|uniref:Creatininase n=1 Tax=Methylocella silvestris (strain DSM 15510 / CIP 108128 / LMG 27833 / NCIMB 13906 / BL2) TaxID=395965 RepID=B8ENJ9_METSB|nr:creatininase family protein [Methylocella silvestris]ACK50130.1 Creatininase [Methylocella silvestris BL2]
MLQTRFWSEMSWTDFRDADMAEVIAVLPVAAIEQHGPHLPVGVDHFIMDGYIEQVAARLPPELPVLFLPVQSVGCSIEHADFPGALSLSAATAIRAWTEIAESVRRAGCRKLVLLNSHGGNSAILNVIAHDLRARLGMLAVMASWSRFGAPDGLFSENEKIHGVHAGDIETSLMLSFRPDLVRMEEAGDFVPESVAIENEFNWLRVGRPTGFGWMSQDLSETGAMGDAGGATARKGEACADYGATAFVELLQDIEGFDLDRLKQGPLG